MSDISDCSDVESLDSDEELQAAFARGELKDGLNLPVPTPKQFINNTSGMKQKLEEFTLKLDWIERLDLTNAPAPAPKGSEIEENDSGAVHDDFKRELGFYRQAQASVLQGLSRLHKLGVSTKRPEDYFAEMAKSDDHMKKVREKLLEKQINIDRRDKARKLRDLRKYGKKVQHEVLLKRQKEKREMLDAVKKFRKGQKEKLEFLDEMEGGRNKRGPGPKKDNKPHIANKKRQYKNSKFGYGGQKKRGKSNTAETSGDMNEYNPKVHSNSKGAKGKGKGKTVRPGKGNRNKMKNKNKKR